MKRIVALLLIVALTIGASTHPPSPIPASGSLPNTFFKPNAPIGPTAYSSTYPSHWDVLGGGGFRAWSTTNDMLSTPLLWRVTGMAGIISNDVYNGTPFIYVLNNDLVTWDAYSLLGGGGGGGGVTNVAVTNVTGLSNLLSAGIVGGLLSITNQSSGTIMDIYRTAGTYNWTNRTGSCEIGVDVIGGGGGGGGGSSYNATNSGIQPGPGTPTSYGGGGGGSAGWSRVVLSTAGLTNFVVSLTVGAGGSGGARQTGNNTNGINGTNGGTSSFGAFVSATGGGGGGMGITTNNTAGTNGVGDYRNGSPGGSWATNAEATGYGAGGGGSGGTFTNSDVGFSFPVTLGKAGANGPTNSFFTILGGAPFDNAYLGGTDVDLQWGRPGTNSAPPYFQVSATPPAYVPLSVLVLGSGGGGGASARYSGFSVIPGKGGWGSYPGGGAGGGGGGFTRDDGITGVLGFGGGAGGTGGVGIVVITSRFAVLVSQ